MPVHSNEADSLCKSRYAEEVVKLTVQIAEPTVMMIQKDVSATFTDHLGTIGEISASCCVLWLQLLIFYFPWKQEGQSAFSPG